MKPNPMLSCQTQRSKPDAQNHFKIKDLVLQVKTDLNMCDTDFSKMG